MFGFVLLLDFSDWFFCDDFLLFGLFFLLGLLFLFGLLDEIHDDQEIVILDADVGEYVGVVGGLALEDDLLRVDFESFGFEDLLLEVEDLGNGSDTEASESMSTLMTSPLRVLTVNFMILKYFQI